MDLSGYYSLNWTCALLPGLALAYLYASRLKNRNLWRAALLAIGILLLGRPAFIQTDKSLDLFLIVDRSRSISEEARTKEREIIELVAARARPGDRVGIVSFNEKAHIERVAGGNAAFGSFTIPYSEDASDLAEAMELSLSQTSGARPARFFILSDGEYTGLDPAAAAQSARQKNIRVYYRHLKRLESFNLAVRGAAAPDQTMTGEPRRVTFTVDATADAPGRYRILRDGQAIASAADKATSATAGWRNCHFKSGENNIQFLDTLPTPGIHSYKIEVESIPYEREKVHADNTAERFVKAVGERPVLLVNNTGRPDNISRVLSAANIPCHIAAIDTFRLTPEFLTGYKGIILNNVPIIKMSLAQIAGIRDFVRQEGGGLLVCGGNRSFSMGGYYKTELESILPVSLEDRQRTRKISTALNITMDCSGSMGVLTPSGQPKMALADNAACECVSLLSPADSLSVIAVDNVPHIFVPQQAVADPASIRSNILRVQAANFGIFIYLALQAAGQELLKASQSNKHILLFSDADHAVEPGDYKTLLDDFARSGITVSVVGLGKENDAFAELLKDIARRGKGSVYFAEDPKQLIQFFTADAITYSRNSFVTNPAPMKIRSGALALSPGQDWTDFSCSGYNLLFAKSGAEIAIQTADEDQAPALAFWQCELGRSAALALDTNGAFANQRQYADILLGGVRWIMGSNVEDNLQIRVAYEGNHARVRMEISEQERATIGAATLQIFTPDGKTITRPLAWDSLNELSATVKLDQTGCYRGVILSGGKVSRIPPLSLPVSPEFASNRPPNFGKDKLAQMAFLTGGRELLDIRDLFERTQTISVVSPVILPLLALFLLLHLLEIAEPRFGLIALTRAAGIALWRAARGALSAVGHRAPPARATGSKRTGHVTDAPSASLAPPSATAPSGATAPPGGTIQPVPPDTAGAALAPSPQNAKPSAQSTPTAAVPPVKDASGMDYLRQSKHQSNRALRSQDKPRK